jgi:hypothetical protein
VTRGVRDSGPTICIVPDCDRSDIAAFALCWPHYTRMKRHGVVGGEIRPPVVNEGPCAVDGCDKDARVRGLCSTHYRRLQTHGDPLYEPPEPVHGRSGRYNSGCRCDECKAAHSVRMRGLFAQLRARLAADPSAAPHGAEGTYSNWGCRCEDCKAAHSVRMRSPEHRAAVAKSRAKRRSA